MNYLIDPLTGLPTGNFRLLDNSTVDALGPDGYNVNAGSAVMAGQQPGLLDYGADFLGIGGPPGSSGSALITLGLGGALAGAMRRQRGAGGAGDGQAVAPKQLRFGEPVRPVSLDWLGGMTPTKRQFFR